MTNPQILGAGALLELFQAHLEVFRQTALQGRKPEGLYEPIDYFLGLQAKRLRPVLILLAHQAVVIRQEKLSERPLALALALELFHNFTLLHDDIMDASPTRRGLPTVHHRWNVNTAILSGDALFALSFEPVAGQVPPIPTRFTRAGLEVCEGQQRDMDLAVLPPSEVKVEDYIEMIRQKTGVLIGASLELGALAAGAPEEVALLFRQAGEQGGIAFQIQDDLLDITATSEEFGKQFAGDILENKKTIFWLHTWHQATTRDQEALLAWTQVPAGDAVRNESKIRGVLDLFEKYGAFQAGQKRMEEAFVEMEKSIQELENRPEIRPEGMAEIRTFFQSLSQRKR